MTCLAIEVLRAGLGPSVGDQFLARHDHRRTLRPVGSRRQTRGQAKSTLSTAAARPCAAARARTSSVRPYAPVRIPVLELPRSLQLALVISDEMQGVE